MFLGVTLLLNLLSYTHWYSRCPSALVRLSTLTTFLESSSLSDEILEHIPMEFSAFLHIDIDKIVFHVLAEPTTSFPDSCKSIPCWQSPSWSPNISHPYSSAQLPQRPPARSYILCLLGVEMPGRCGEAGTRRGGKGAPKDAVEGRPVVRRWCLLPERTGRKGGWVEGGLQEQVLRRDKSEWDGTPFFPYLWHNHQL